MQKEWSTVFAMYGFEPVRDILKSQHLTELHMQITTELTFENFWDCVCGVRALYSIGLVRYSQ